MQRRHSFTLPTLIALAFPAMLTNCVAEPATDPGAGGTGAVAGSGVAGSTAGSGTAGTATAGTAGAPPASTGGSSGVGGTGVGGSAGTGVAGTGTAGTGMAGTGTAGTGTAGTGTAGGGGVIDGAGGTAAGAAGTAGTAQGGTAGDASGGTSGTGTGAGGYNTDAACMGIRSAMACTPEGQDCPNLRCGLSDLGRRACVCSTLWTCESCTFPADAPQEVIGEPAAALPACDAATVVKGDPCTMQGERCQPAEAGDVCACWPIAGVLEWDCDSKPWE